ncbi:MAG: tyrosine-protein phosphatase [Bdellovibrionota bacterium]
MTKLNITTFFFALALALQFSAATAQAAAVEDIPNLFKMNDNLYRGGRVTAAGMKQLKKMGVTTILNIENDVDAIKVDKKFAEANGMRYITIPFETWSTPSDAKVDTVLKLLQDRSLGPIYLHCKHGRDRTGMIMGLYRVFVDGWHPKAAYKEMKNRGFRTMIWTLDNYYKKRSGY